jgi:hypothetical protein
VNSSTAIQSIRVDIDPFNYAFIPSAPSNDSLRWKASIQEGLKAKLLSRPKPIVNSIGK